MNEQRARLGSEMFHELCKPRLVSAPREGRGLSRPRADALCGLTVAIVAPPLSMTSAAI